MRSFQRPFPHSFLSLVRYTFHLALLLGQGIIWGRLSVHWRICMGSITAKTTQGKRREQEDRLVVLSCDDGYILAVCDGHNGYETASRAIAVLVELSMEHPTRGSLAGAATAQAFLLLVVERLVKETRNDDSG